MEYKIPGAYQTPVLRNESFGDVAKVSPFMKALRQLMRADPDIIMVGEIRDMETAQLAIQGVRSGHMLVSTIHADGAPICFDRLIGMGVERNDLCSVGLIAGLIYQKLVPVLCEHCKIPYGEWLASNDYDEALDSRIRRVVPEDELRQLYFRNRAGCPHCDHDGVRGRE
ncbi:MAG: ATPase, T2SS/T4P/T4SS family, partial [Azovibrio sp.]|nr:ATPase, T2SS/T4P/T4SS family [Azovibrio sp.]